jgi:hypothetical protein
VNRIYHSIHRGGTDSRGRPRLLEELFSFQSAPSGDLLDDPAAENVLERTGRYPNAGVAKRFRCASGESRLARSPTHQCIRLDFLQWVSDLHETAVSDLTQIFSSAIQTPVCKSGWALHPFHDSKVGESVCSDVWLEDALWTALSSIAQSEEVETFGLVSIAVPPCRVLFLGKSMEL